MRSRVWVLLLLALAVTLAVSYHQNSSSTSTGRSHHSTTAGALPPEAIATIRLIDRGGPFPYERDGAVFENRERLLPQHSGGYWREYTVPTPGEDDRGARRIIRGSGGEVYYSGDHYASFRRVTEQARGSG